MFKLVIEDDEGTRTMVPLTREQYVVGRKEGATIRLTERNISREHVKLLRENAGRTRYVLEDVSSYNGVYVNGLRVATNQELVHGDLIQLGDYRILFQDESIRSDVPPTDYDENVDLKKTMPRAFRGSLLTERPDRLVVLVGPTPGAEFPLDHERMTIGRAEEADISVNHNSVSRIHCEVHALGDGRFEIVDQSSSNGVIVNGSELRRSIIEPGDTIELGDVRFRFVAAGQVFVPNPAEGSALTAIGDRDLSDSVNRRATGILLPALAGIVLGVIALSIVAVMYMRKTPTSGRPVATSDPSNGDYEREEKLLTDAVKACTKENCDESHRRITTDIREGSRLRESQDFKFIETQWSEGILEKANESDDDAKKRELYRRVAEATTVELSVRKTAERKLAVLDEQAATPTPIVTATAIPTTTTSAPAVTTTPPTSSDLAHRPRVPGTTSAPVPPPPRVPVLVQPPATAPVKTSDTPQDHTVPVTNLAASTKAALLPKARLGNISKDDARQLYAACKELKDQDCKNLASKFLGP